MSEGRSKRLTVPQSGVARTLERKSFGHGWSIGPGHLELHAGQWDAKKERIAVLVRDNSAWTAGTWLSASTPRAGVLSARAC